MSFKGMMAIIMVTQKNHLKRSKKIKIGKKGKEEITAAPWMDRKGKRLIELRRVKNRTWRRARKKNAPQRELRLLKRKYEMQKWITSIYLGKRKGDWEQEMIEKVRTNSKILWNFARDIAGKTKKKNENTYIYIEGEKKALELVWKLYISTWKKEIYQKALEMDLTFWYGSRNKIGLKEIMRREDEENIANGGSKMMPVPIMTEEEMMKIIKRQKKRKGSRHRWCQGQ